MSLGLSKYIEQSYPGYQFSSVRYAQSTVQSGFATVSLGKSRENANAIYVSSIQWDYVGDSIPSGIITFKDNAGNILLNQRVGGSYNNKQYFNYFQIYKNTLFVQANSNHVIFVVEYQLCSRPGRVEIKQKSL